ncbi:hypothetical protein GCM10009555_073140 [Acrocarpospora macrocephala]|uniref:Carrier domain-containing protein n=1 Tax=Acrocarpospora macrocephala TaxID=150177 RepID=A0A5M3WK53_9ACTN|nr:non-ribosomal peptide synthetase [Acrocarpospora macrocephala]GES08539.1 hypothetical protein Amac_021350 [Acrocarpospora macrocephala]
MAQPLSYGQERLWFLHRLDPEDHSYNTCHADRLRGPIDLDRLAAAFTAVAARQESLRTRFDEIDGTPVAILCPPEPITITVRDAADIGDARRIVSAAANAPFDLSAAPPLRVTLVRLAPDDHILAITLHHIIADGMSVALLSDEIAHYYAGRPPLPPLPVQYAEHARAERANGPAELGRWARALAGTPVLELPVDRPRPPQRTGDGGEVEFVVAPELVAGVAELARAHRCTPFMVWLTAYQVLLARHSGQEDFCVGSPVARRDRTELEPLIGHLSGTLVLRTDLSGNPSFLEAVKRTRRTVIEAISHADVPLERLLGALEIERDLSRTPLFQTMFALHTQVTGEASAGPVPGTDATPFTPGWMAARTDLSLDLWPSNRGLVGSLIYSADVFAEATARRLAERFQVLVESIVGAPETRVHDLEMLPAGERDWLLSRGSFADVPPVTLADLVLAQAAATPDAVAVDEMKYADLVGRAAGLAARLRDKGVGRGSLVAVQVSRGPGILVAFLGVTLAGAAYLPVDPEYPQARVDYVLRDSGAVLVLTDDDLGETGVPVPGWLPRPDDTAYVLYTSGSTGRPKGVIVPHGALANLLLAMRELIGSTPEHAWLALTSTAFDISAVELFLPLITGGRVVMATADHARDGMAAAELIRRSGATHVQATPSGWRILLTGDFPEITGITAGEPLSPQLARELCARTNRLINGYGPTETTIYSSTWDVDSTDITIGHPITNTRAYILGRSGLSPIGVPGELVLGGHGVTTGYLGRAALTAEKFVPSPYGPAGSRLYRTGDLARWRPNGTIEFLGRTDNQIKLRGHRIELGEIESVLDSYPGVRQAVATVCDDTLIAFIVLTGDVHERTSGSGTNDDAHEHSSGSAVDGTVHEQTSETTASGGVHGRMGGSAAGAIRPQMSISIADDVRAHAARVLPGYMVPRQVVVLDEMPMTPNGKVDRGALPGHTPAARADRVPPRTDAERMVVSVFAEVLGRDAGEIGAYDDFFALGGHSLLATMVIARLPIRVPVREVFTRPTAAALAELLEAPGVPDREGPVPRPAGTTPPLSSGQERLWFLNRLYPETDAAFNMWVVRRLRGPLDVDALRNAFSVVAGRHESLRTHFPDADGVPVAVIDPPGPFPVEYLTGTDATQSIEQPENLTGGGARQTTDPPGSFPVGPLAGVDVAQAVAERVNTPFALDERPPIRVTLIRQGDDDHVLCLVAHHILGDGWSLNLMLDELADAYSGRSLPEVPLQFGDVAVWQRGRDTAELLEYWRDRLADPTPLDLPTDRPRSVGSAGRGATVDFRLSAGDAAALTAMGRRHGATLFMTLLAAYQVLLARHSGRDDILVGTSNAGRDTLALESVVGYLTDILVLRGDLSGDPAFTDLLAATRTSVLDAFAHQGIPFEELVSTLKLERDLTRTPVFQTMAILHTEDSGREPRPFAGLTVEGFPGGHAQAKFDLMLEAWHDEGAELLVQLEYDTALFDTATIEAMASRLQRLLLSITTNPSQHLSALPLLTGADETFLATVSEGPHLPAPRPVLDLITDSIQKYPDLVAISCGDRQVTYRELGEMIEKTARPGGKGAIHPGNGASGSASLGESDNGLRPGNGTAAEHAVGGEAAGQGEHIQHQGEISGKAENPGEVAGKGRNVQRPGEVGAVTGGLEDAGTGGNVQPPGEVEAIASGGEDAGIWEVSLERSPEGIAALLGAWKSGAAYLPIDPALPAERIDFMRSEATATPADGVACVLYTSGSTGVPKGVLIEHTALAARVAWMVAAYGIRPGDRIVQFAALSFDTHAEEIYPALAAGATLELLPDGPVTLPDVLATPNGQGVTVLDLPTAYWHHLVGQIDEIAWPSGLRLVILGGEEVQAAAVARWRSRFGERIRVVNTYGPTETTIIATAADLIPADGQAGSRPPIGRPIAETRVVVLDRSGVPVPPGAPGELCIGGAGVARGYLRRPELTAERFVAWGEQGARLYRSGDRARWRPDGQLEFLGRIDEQVKVRGFRVEPGEVEARLLAHPRVRQVAVTAAEDRLAAYVVADGVTRAELTAFAGESLPAYMVPSVWVWLEELPLTRHGKVDRRALPYPEIEIQAGSVPPRTDAEQLVAEVYGEVLGVGEVGALDDFFAIGGHSLLAARVIARIRSITGVDVPIRTMFDGSTVAALAEAVETLLVEELEGLSDEEAALLARSVRSDP